MESVFKKLQKYSNKIINRESNTCLINSGKLWAYGSKEKGLPFIYIFQSTNELEDTLGITYYYV